MLRRQFLTSSFFLGPAALASIATTHAIDPIPRKGGPLLKLSLAAYSYRDYLTGKKQPAMQQSSTRDDLDRFSLSRCHMTRLSATNTKGARVRSA